VRSVDAGARLAVAMKRAIAALSMLTLMGSVVVACTGDDSYASGGGGYVDCSAYTSCGTCTPVLGCGWCSFPDGTGACTGGPGQCGGEEFTWSWEPSGCGLANGDAATVDAGGADAVSADGATSTSTSTSAADGASSEVAVDAASSEATSAETGEVGGCASNVPFPASCVVTTGGSACRSGETTIACPIDDAGGASETLAGCRAVPHLSGAGANYFCCPCSGG
jgi:hypothetical protein